MKILHLFYYDKKFFPQFYHLIKDNFGLTNHHFIVLVNEISDEHNLQNVTYVTNGINMNKISKLLIDADKIILHSLMLGQLLLNFFLNPQLLKKTFWAIWGADLYSYYEKKVGLKAKLFEHLRSFIIKRLFGMITQVEGDAILAKNLYESKATWFYSFMYPSNVIIKPQVSRTEKNEEISIQLGNSAGQSNDHKEALYILSTYKDKKVKVYAPLSYGDNEYAQEIKKYGENIFGEKFVAMLDFLPLEDYLSWQDKIDIALFNNKRQQAIGNITTLIGYGKKVYIRNDITTWLFCERHGLKVYDIQNATNDLLEPMSKIAKEHNVKQVSKLFSKEKLLKDLNAIFNEKI